VIGKIAVDGIFLQRPVVFTSRAYYLKSSGMSHYRKYPMAKKFHAKKIGEDQYIILWVFSDLNEELLNEHLHMAIVGEDYEYAEAVKAEAQLRGIKLKVRLNG
jgi:hypothetical protein